MSVGFVGAGNMAAAMARGWAAAGRARADVVHRLGLGPGGGAGGRGRGEAVASNAELAERADLVVLAVKPAALEGVAELGAASAAAVLSLLGATPLEPLAAAFPGSASSG